MLKPDSFFLIFCCCLCFPQWMTSQTNYPKGYYLDYESLRDTIPDGQAQVEITKRSEINKKWWGGNDYKIRFANYPGGKRVIRKHWVAYSDGTRLYLNVIHLRRERGYSKVNDEGVLMLFDVGILEKSKRAIFIGASIGAVAGLVGAFIVGGIVTSVVSGKGEPYYLDLRNMNCARISVNAVRSLTQENEILHYKFMQTDCRDDPLTRSNYLMKLNDFLALSEKEKEEQMISDFIPGEVDLVLYRPKRHQDSSSFYVSVNGDSAFEAEINSYLYIPAATNPVPYQICWSGETSDCIEVARKVPQLIFVQCAKNAETAEISLVHMEEEEGFARSQRAKKAQEKRMKKLQQ